MKYKTKGLNLEEELLLAPTEEYFSTKSLKRAVWQYLIDHSKIVAGDNVKFYFHVKGEEDFWWRVSNRDNGTFKRKDLLDFRNEMYGKSLRVKRAMEAYRFLNEASQNTNRILRIGTFTEKSLLKIAKYVGKFEGWLRGCVLSKYTESFKKENELEAKKIKELYE